MSASEKRPLRILAADDSAVMRSILWKLFLMQKESRSSELPQMELCGIARDGVECLEQVKQLCPDVLVLDLEMPRLNGLEVLDRLRLENSDLPVIMCSAYTEHGARSTLEALARGASDYVMKPSEQRDLDSTSGNAVIRYRSNCCRSNRRFGQGGRRRSKGRETDRIELPRPTIRRG